MTSRMTGLWATRAAWVSASVASISLTSAALADDTSGVYVGANFGRARNSYQTQSIDDQLVAEAASAGETIDFTARSTQRMSDVWWFDAGYLVTPYVGIDASFIHLGEVRYVALGKLNSATRAQSLVVTAEGISHGPSLSLVLRLPLAESLAADLRIGDYLGKTILDNYVAVGTDAAFSAPSKTTSSLLAGIGVAYTVAGHWSVRADYLRVNKTGDEGTTGKFSVNLATVGVSYTF